MLEGQIGLLTYCESSHLHSALESRQEQVKPSPIQSLLGSDLIGGNDVVLLVTSSYAAANLVQVQWPSWLAQT